MKLGFTFVIHYLLFRFIKKNISELFKKFIGTN